VFREAKRRENDNYILRAKNKSKVIWQVIHKETGKTSSQKQDTKIVRNSEEITNPYKLSELFNYYFCEISEKLLKKKGEKIPTSENYHLKINKSSKTTFLFPITESEVVKVARCSKNKLTAGIDEIPDHVVRGVANLWYESYLSLRQQCVETNSRKQGTYVSTTRGITHGVPQGSILGPILFLLHINDLPLNVSESNIVLFVDDTNILVSEKNLNTVQSRLNRVMKDLQMWFTLNNLIVNANKTLAISFHTTQNKKPALPHVLFEDRGIPYNTDTKFLGINISGNVKWINHIRYLRSKLNTSLYMISSLKHVTSTRVLKTMYFACFHIHLR
jgi:hypothetical protein